MNFNKYKNISKLYDIDIKNNSFETKLKRLTLSKKKSLGRSYGSIVN